MSAPSAVSPIEAQAAWSAVICSPSITVIRGCCTSNPSSRSAVTLPPLLDGLAVGRAALRATSETRTVYATPDTNLGSYPVGCGDWRGGWGWMLPARDRTAAGSAIATHFRASKHQNVSPLTARRVGVSVAPPHDSHTTRPTINATRTEARP